MLSATASLGLIHMWDVDGGLVPIDKWIASLIVMQLWFIDKRPRTKIRLLRRYLYTNDHNIKAGALLAIGLVNCGVRNECDPALALLSDYVYSENVTLRIGAVLGLGLAYAGSQRSDVTELLTGVLVDEASTFTMINCQYEIFRRWTIFRYHGNCVSRSNRDRFDKRWLCRRWSIVDASAEIDRAYTSKAV